MLLVLLLFILFFLCFFLIFILLVSYPHIIYAVLETVESVTAVQGSASAAPRFPGCELHFKPLPMGQGQENAESTLDFACQNTKPSKRRPPCSNRRLLQHSVHVSNALLSNAFVHMLLCLCVLHGNIQCSRIEGFGIVNSKPTPPSLSRHAPIKVTG